MLADLHAHTRACLMYGVCVRPPLSLVLFWPIPRLPPAGMFTFMAVTTFSAFGFLQRFFAAEMSEIASALHKEGAEGLNAPLSVIAAGAPRHLIAAFLVMFWSSR